MGNPTLPAERHATASDKFRHSKRVLKHLASQEHDKLIADYLDAFRACNTMNESPSIEYVGGYFVFKSKGSTHHRKYRRAQFEIFRDRLRERVREATKTSGE